MPVQERQLKKSLMKKKLVTKMSLFKGEMVVPISKGSNLNILAS